MPGLTTQVDIISHGTYVYRALGRARLPYLTEHWESDYTFTNVANGSTRPSTDSGKTTSSAGTTGTARTPA